jgi:hypothetical protein
MKFNKNIVFCFPYRGAGGVSNQFVRLAEKLSNKSEYKVYVVDYSDGFMAKNKGKNVTLIEYFDKGNVEVPRNSLLIFQAMTPWSIFPALKVHRSTFVLFWQCHPRNFVIDFPFFGPRNTLFFKILFYRYFIKIKRFYDLLIRNKALVYIDGVTLSATNSSLRVDDEKATIIPIPISIPDERDVRIRNKRITNAECMKFCWIGRISDFKYPILIYTLKKINALADDFEEVFEFDIIGDGRFLNKLKDDVSSLKKVKINFLGELSPSKVKGYLLTKPDMMFAMGTSAVEGAILGIPVVLLNFSYKEVLGDYVYKFLHKDNNNASVGEEINENHILQGNISLSQCIREAIDEKDKLKGELRAYSESVHGIDSIVTKLVKHSDRVTLKWGDIQDSGVMNQGLLYRFKKFLNKIKVGI